MSNSVINLPGQLTVPGQFTADGEDVALSFTSPNRASRDCLALRIHSAQGYMGFNAPCLASRTVDTCRAVAISMNTRLITCILGMMIWQAGAAPAVAPRSHTARVATPLHIPAKPVPPRLIAQPKSGSLVVNGTASSDKFVVRVRIYAADGTPVQKADAVVDSSDGVFVAGLRNPLQTGQVVQVFLLVNSEEVQPSAPVVVLDARSDTPLSAANTQPPTAAMTVEPAEQPPQKAVLPVTGNPVPVPQLQTAVCANADCWPCNRHCTAGSRIFPARRA
jgi:hypothetical protein